MTPASMEMVQYWKKSEMVEAKVMEVDGVLQMQMAGEKYPFPGFPRGYLLFGKLSKLKHEIKNQIFNDSWSMLENGSDCIAERVKREVLPNIYDLFDDFKYDVVPPQKMVGCVREIYRAWSKVSPQSSKLRDVLCLILQEDDAYRFRLQWIVGYMPTFLFRFINPVNPFLKSLVWLENGEVIGDMKERIRLFRRVIGELLKDEQIRQHFTALFREIDWRKIRMTNAEKYFFRGKYFKVDLDKFDY